MNVDILKDSKSNLTSNMMPNMRVIIIVMLILRFELTLPYLIKTMLKFG